eukprot:CAMPEP_0185845998 /NCGR_PEP_ID=MMETSP1354-20130828/1800_1 /TAXON_ID=708628 /ORGANISM="Erythrolobus madagascarensis, Strain CCMP3276" /LENGTH=314 /DNA_ID=CAMNT_0028546081 /DNA_START=5 /DNA_END=949 /DNA_ORIENTATION=-
MSKPAPLLTGAAAPRPRPGLVHDDYVWNFGYGSNIYPPAKLHLRGAPGSGGIDFEEFQLGKLRGWRLSFDFAAFPPVEPSMGSIEPVRESDLVEVGGKDGAHFGVHDSEGCMYGALIKLKREDYDKLWRSEGGGNRSPGYAEVEVECETSSGDTVRAVAFRVVETRKHSGDIAPSLRYRSLIVEGAHKLGVPEEYQVALERIPKVLPLPRLVRPLFASSIMLFFRMRRSDSDSVQNLGLVMHRLVFNYEMLFHPLRITAETRASENEAKGRKLAAATIRALATCFTIVEGFPIGSAMFITWRGVKYCDATKLIA